MGYKETILAMHPISYWRFGESSGTVATDEIGTENGVYVNSPILLSEGAPEVDDGDKSVGFYNSLGDPIQYVRVADNPLHRQKNISLDFWFKITGWENINIIVQKWGEGSYEDDCYNCWVDNVGTFVYGISTGLSSMYQIKGTVPGAVSLGVWYRCKFIYTIDGRLRIYLNGTKRVDTLNPNCNNRNIGPGITPLYVGTNCDALETPVYNGKSIVDELAIFDYDIYPEVSVNWAIEALTPNVGFNPLVFTVTATPLSGQSIGDYQYDWQNEGFVDSNEKEFLLTESDSNFVVELDCKNKATGVITHHTRIFDIRVLDFEGVPSSGIAPLSVDFEVIDI